MTASQGVLVFLLVVRKDSSEPVGSVACYGVDDRNGHAHVAANVFAPYMRLGWPLEGFYLFLNYLFDAFPFRKLYATALEPNSYHFKRALGTVLHEEGRLRRHEYAQGRYVDQVTLALYREDWVNVSPFGSGLLQAIRGREDRDSAEILR